MLQNMKETSGMENQMVKEHTLTLEEESMLGYSRRGKEMVMGHTLFLMGESM